MLGFYHINKNFFKDLKFILLNCRKNKILYMNNRVVYIYMDILKVLRYYI